MITLNRVFKSRSVQSCVFASIIISGLVLASQKAEARRRGAAKIAPINVVYMQRQNKFRATFRTPSCSYNANGPCNRNGLYTWSHSAVRSYITRGYGRPACINKGGRFRVTSIRGSRGNYFYNVTAECRNLPDGKGPAVGQRNGARAKTNVIAMSFAQKGRNGQWRRPTRREQQQMVTNKCKNEVEERMGKYLVEARVRRFDGRRLNIGYWYVRGTCFWRNRR